MSSDLRGYQPPPLNDEAGPSPDLTPEDIYPVADSDAPAATRPSDGPYVETTLDDARRAYVKVHYERFAGYFDRCDAVGGMRLSFGLAPFLFGELWFLYRKMYLEGLLLLAASLLISGYMKTYYLAGPDAIPHLDPLIQLAAAILLSVLGKGLYWKATDRRIENAMRHYPRAPHQALAWLDSVGGVNVPIVIVVLALKIIFFGVVMAVGASMVESGAV